MMTADTALRQAWMTANEYAGHTHHELTELLEIDQMTPAEQRKQLAPFAAVWAAMITAAASDFRTAMVTGSVEGVEGSGATIAEAIREAGGRFAERTAELRDAVTEVSNTIFNHE